MGAAAVYARKSTDQAVCDEEKSVTRQVELAVACARTHGFEVPPEHIYVDDAISGAEFDRRPGLMRLLNTLRPQAPFAGLFLADKDRLGREQFETNHILKQISVAGVRIFEYQNGGHEVRLESPIDKLIMSVSNFAAELERAKASQRTRDALQLKAQRGYVAGGTVFGYRNVPVVDKGGQRSHVVREIREDEAATVRHIFRMAAGGTGLRTIARALNAEGVRSPRARAGRHHSWAPSSVRSVLFNSLYKGEVVWGRTKKRDAWGRRKESNRPTNEWVITSAEHLRIVSDDLWAKAHGALDSRQKAYGFKRGSPRPVGALDAKYLLTGMGSVASAAARSCRPGLAASQPTGAGTTTVEARPCVRTVSWWTCTWPMTPSFRRSPATSWIRRSCARPSTLPCAIWSSPPPRSRHAWTL